ncbi:succinylglutamate desuccinylase/aspartoacylase family protein [Pelagibacterium lentulum]|uniref:N-alpha-acetyl diaminobutyric acid deacetylase DoeB n=1 Tax=Pelagibacterium lentulum TaxID=2029865 RepID=A0A916RME3_9HYPH|nr:succinylglutamate desuccinylase/aspartoacylase family protein [Pelagibacterium lentulum]GGA61716.1 N-alpha-acetyl diaminobutyric acid deacetylase DoeB [Pelagibacterium lentulum]
MAAQLTIDLDTPGKQHGSLLVPYSSDRSAYGQIVVPITAISGAPGPTFVVTGGVHGDEYEGQFILARLAREIKPADIRGRIIIIPVCNPPASAAGRRTSPVDGVNMARCFPGRVNGSPTEQIVEAITRLILPSASFLLDFHSGGSTLEYIPATLARLPQSTELAASVLDLMLAFDAPLSLLLGRPENSGTLVSTALELGVSAIATELGGGGGVTPQTVETGWRGLWRVLASLNMVSKKVDLQPERTRVMAVEPHHFVRAYSNGYYEPLVGLGDTVTEGQYLGHMWRLEEAGAAPVPLVSGTTGLCVCRRVPTATAPGDVLLHTARDISQSEVLSLAMA